MQYTVKTQYARGSEIPIAEFKDLNDAKLFIEKKLQTDAALNVKVTYLIFEFNEVIEKFDPSNIDSSSTQAQGSKGSGASFSPTPFNTTPRPAGTPQKWIKDDEDKEKKE